MRKKREYVYREIWLTTKCQEKYLEARKNGQAKQCFIGRERQYRMTERDSYYTDISDMNVVLLYCIYPLHVNGHTEIREEVQEIIKEMAESRDVLQIYQVFSLIVSQEIKKDIYSNLPVEIDFSEVLDTLFAKRVELEEEMKAYKLDGVNSVWKRINDICKGSKTIQEYMS
ncbi:MAG: NAD glycohydrolase inhibitor [Bacteroides sp.]|nr:NAD glycohydrolase inhibitor [Bacteroides sp.]MCM1549743.1 NAD glycohydrolase inhibitor [Clostridium sp.]